MSESIQVNLSPTEGTTGPLAPNQQAPVPAPSPRPAWLPEKFKTPEEFAGAYSALESKLGQPKAPEAAPASKGVEQPAPGTGGLLTETELTNYSSEYEKNGALSDVSYQALSKKGITKDLVDAFIAGQLARGSQFAQTAIDAAGGQSQYEAMAAWAGANLSDQDLTRYNASVNSRDPATIQWAVRGMLAMFKQAGGGAGSSADNHVTGDPRFRTGPNRVQPQSQGAAAPFGSQVQQFQSTAQVVQAMRDPRYRSDPAYRAAVEAALAGPDSLFNVKVS